jgi:hypothetical protein
VKKINDPVRQQTIKEIQEFLQDKKEEVIIDVRTAIAVHIGGKSPKECLALVLRDKEGVVVQHLPMEAEKRYALVLLAFLRKKTYEGHEVDSELTDSTSEVVAEAFSTRIEKDADRLAALIMPLILSDQRFAKAISEHLVSLSQLPPMKQLQRKVTSILMHKLGVILSHTIDTTMTTAIKASVVKVAAASISSPIAIKITASIVTSLGAALKPILIKLLASAAFKAAIIAKVKAIIVGSVLAAFIKIIGVKIGMGAGAAFAFILLPALIAWLIYEYRNFPEKLSTKVSESVATDMAANFEETSMSLAETLVERIIIDGAGIVAANLIHKGLVDSLMQESIREAT